PRPGDATALPRALRGALLPPRGRRGDGDRRREAPRRRGGHDPDPARRAPLDRGGQERRALPLLLCAGVRPRRHLLLARVGLPGHLPGDAALLDDAEIAVVRDDLSFDSGLVARHDREPRGIVPQPLVLARRQAESFGAVGIAALADELDRRLAASARQALALDS